MTYLDSRDLQKRLEELEAMKDAYRFYPDVWQANRYGVELCQDFSKRTASVDAILNARKKV